MNTRLNVMMSFDTTEGLHMKQGSLKFMVCSITDISSSNFCLEWDIKHKNLYCVGHCGDSHAYAYHVNWLSYLCLCHHYYIILSWFLWLLFNVYACYIGDSLDCLTKVHTRVLQPRTTWCQRWDPKMANIRLDPPVQFDFSKPDEWPK